MKEGEKGGFAGQPREGYVDTRYQIPDEEMLRKGKL